MCKQKCVSGAQGLQFIRVCKSRQAHKFYFGYLLCIFALCCLVGCGAGVFAPQVAAGPVLQVPVLAGTATGGTLPLTNATIQIYATNTESNGGQSTALLSKSVTTDSNGSFDILETPNCPSDDALVYMVAARESSDSTSASSAPSMVLMSALGKCSNLKALKSVQISPVTTVASIWSLAAFMSSPTQLGSAPEQSLLLDDAFITVQELVDPASGLIPGPLLPNTLTVPTAKINALASILSACGDALTSGASSSKSCTSIYASAPNIDGTLPKDLFTAALNIAKNPLQNVSQIYQLVPTTPAFDPALTQEPPDWKLELGGFVASPVFSVDGGSYPAAQTVAISEQTTPSLIHVTADGSTPNESSPVYSAPLLVNASGEIQAVAVTGHLASAVSRVALNIQATQSNTLMFSREPTSTVAGATLGTVQVLIPSDSTNAADSNTVVSLSLSGGTSSAVLKGTKSVVAVKGVATFSDLSVTASGTGFSLVASTSGLAPVQSSQFDIQIALPSELAHAADSFVDSVGIQTHFLYYDTPYAQFPKALSLLKQLGVRHFRDSLPFDSVQVGDYQQLGAAGLKCTCGLWFPNTFSTQDILNSIKNAGNVETLEAPNECDAGSNCGGGGYVGVANVVSYLPFLSALSKTANLPLLGPSLTTQNAYIEAGNIASLITANNLHVYMGGRNPESAGWGAGDSNGNAYGSFLWWMDQSQQDAPGLAAQVTETGYMAFPVSQAAGEIPESVEASYIPRTLLYSYLLGNRRTFVYELLDEYPTTGYGLLRNDLSKKPAFLAMQNLIAQLADPGQSFIPGALRYQLTGVGSTVQHALFQKADGTFLLILWLPQSSFDVNKNLTVSNSSMTAHLSLNATNRIASITKFDSTGAAIVQSAAASSTTADLTLSDQLTIVTVKPN